MNFFNISFSQVFTSYLALKTKRIKFYQRIDFDPARTYGQSFDLELFYKNSIENISEMTKRLTESVNIIQSLKKSAQIDIMGNTQFYSREIKEEMLQHFEDIRGIMKDIVLIFEYIYLQRRDLLKELFIEFEGIYTFSKEINLNIASIFRLTLIKEKRLVVIDTNIETIKQKLLKINLPISLLSSQKELDGLEPLIISVNQYLTSTKKEIKTLEL